MSTDNACEIKKEDLDLACCFFFHGNISFAYRWKERLSIETLEKMTVASDRHLEAKCQKLHWCYTARTETRK